VVKKTIHMIFSNDESNRFSCAQLINYTQFRTSDIKNTDYFMFRSTVTGNFSHPKKFSHIIIAKCNEAIKRKNMSQALASTNFLPT